MTVSIVAAFCLPLFSLSSADSSGRLLEESRLLELHASVIRAHLVNDIEMILSDETEDYVAVSRGEIDHPSLDDRRRNMGGFSRRARFEYYRDETPPIATVSEDGTLGWVIVQIHAKGTRVSDNGGEEQMEYVSAWVELYRKFDGRWNRTGTVSNFKP